MAKLFTMLVGPLHCGFFVIQSVILSLDWSFCHSIGDLVVKFVVSNCSIMGKKHFQKRLTLDRPVETVSRYLQYW